MITVLVLSFSHNTVINNQTLRVYQWVKVGRSQVGEGMDYVPTLPDFKRGSTITFRVDSNEEQLLRVMGDRQQLRQLTKEEKKTVADNNAPVIRLG